MALADDIVYLVERKQHRLHLTEQDIAEFLYGQNNAYQQLVNSECRRLVDAGRLERQGKGGQADPYTYRTTPIKRRL
jgi:hypothetical protein